jgi:predicted small secreted protein
MIGGFKMSKLMRGFALAMLLLLSLLLAGCSSNVGVGLSVGIPVGNHGYISVGGSSNRWY